MLVPLTVVLNRQRGINNASIRWQKDVNDANDVEKLNNALIFECTAQSNCPSHVSISCFNDV